MSLTGTTPMRVSVTRLLPLSLLALTVACGTSHTIPVADAQQDSLKAGTAANTPAATSALDEGVIVVNGVALNTQTVQWLQQVYPVVIPAGRYWYDPVSGAWGRDGEPIAGQMMAGLTLGGTLARDASRGASGVYINGRQITDGEKLYIERRCQTPVAPARYWILSNGIGGYEGAPALFNLGQCPGVPQQNGGARSMSRTFCDGNGACTSTGILGSITTAY